MTAEFFSGNRQRFLAQMEEDSVAILYSGLAPVKSNDQDMSPFAVNRNFYYLTGIDEPGVWLVLSKGAVVSLMDRSVIMNRPLREMAMSTAKSRGIPVQYKRYVAGGTDAGSIHLAQGGIPSLVMAVPCRYIHSPSSVCKLSDVDALRALTLAMLEEIGRL